MTMIAIRSVNCVNLFIGSLSKCNNNLLLQNYQLVDHRLKPGSGRSKTEVQRDVQNSKVREQDKSRRDWSQH